MSQPSLPVFRVLTHIILPAWLILFPGIAIAANLTMDNIVIGGTGSSLGTMRILAKAFSETNPDINIVVLPSLGSTGGIMALLDGKIQIGVTGRLLKDSEQRPHVQIREYARTPFIIAVRFDNQINEITTKELECIYAGKTINWPDGSRLRLMLRPESDKDSQLLKSISPVLDSAVTQAVKTKGVLLAITDQDSADILENISGSIGTGSLSLLISEKRRLKALKFNGVEPNVENLANGTYPYFKQYFLLTRQNPDLAVMKFITFIYSDSGQEILKQTGNLPIENTEHN